AEKHIVAAVLYDSSGKKFAQYAVNLSGIDAFDNQIPLGFRFYDDHLEGLQSVVHESQILGNLYLRSDLTALNERFLLYGMVVLFVMALALLIAYGLSWYLSKSISLPLLALSEAATAVSNHQDFTVRARKVGNDEIGYLTDAFNHMLGRIQTQNLTLSR